MLLDAAEIVALIRDVALLVMLVITTLAVIIIYFKLSSVLNTAKRTLESIEGIVSTVSEKLVAPAAAGSGLAFGFGKLAAFLFGSRKSEKDKD